MNQLLLGAIILSELVSLVLVVLHWKKAEHPILKVLVSVVAFIPILGPGLYFFVSDTTPPQSEGLKNTLPRGYYTHGWITMRPLWKRTTKEKEDAATESDNNT